MKGEKQYTILGADGEFAGSVWATKVQRERDGNTPRFWFYRGSAVVASAWFGYVSDEGKVLLNPEEVEA